VLSEEDVIGYIERNLNDVIKKQKGIEADALFAKLAQDGDGGDILENAKQRAKAYMLAEQIVRESILTIRQKTR
jgi:hypothetical protein